MCRKHQLKKIKKRNIRKAEKLARKRQIKRELKELEAAENQGMRLRGLRDNQVGKLDVIEEDDEESESA